MKCKFFRSSIDLSSPPTASASLLLLLSSSLSLSEQTDALLLTAELEEERNVGCDCNSIPFAPRSSSPSLSLSSVRPFVRVCVRPARAELGGLYSLGPSRLSVGVCGGGEIVVIIHGYKKITGFLVSPGFQQLFCSAHA